ncbi:MAG: conjugal transfer protein TraX [Candidatus Gastranaerophilales bacterium]|nr:conjugal transfer protein TraX [Candidatus Gastranaerophilales bacterium]
MEEVQERKKPEENGVVRFHHRGLSGSTLKLIAVITMLVDHTAAVLLARMLLTRRVISTAERVLEVTDYASLYRIYSVMRSIGRIAFPIYCFLLVEGFHRTHSAKKYALRLGIFALVSEIPFDLAFNASFLEIGYQNVFFTLFLGLLTMMAVDWARYKIRNRVLCFLSAGAMICIGGLAAHFLQTDYGARGVLCIMVLYVTARWRPVQMVAGAVSFLWELPAPMAFLPMVLYNGKRGINLKYVFYAFYPIHLLCLYLISLFLGLAGVAVV